MSPFFSVTTLITCLESFPPDLAFHPGSAAGNGITLVPSTGKKWEVLQETMVSRSAV